MFCLNGLLKCLFTLSGICGDRILNDQRHLAAIFNRRTELLRSRSCRRSVIGHTGGLNPLIAVSRIKRNDVDSVFNGKIELDGRRVLINTRNGNHIGIARHLFI